MSNSSREEVLCAVAAFALFFEKEEPKTFTVLDETIPEPETIMAETQFTDFQSPTLSEMVEPVKKVQPILLMGNSEDERSKPLLRKSSRIKGLETKRINKEIEQGMIVMNNLFCRTQKGPKGGKTAAKLLELWRNMQRNTCYWLQEIYDHRQLQRAKFISFFLNSTNILRKTVNGSRPRSPEVHELTLRFIVDFNKLYEVAILRGIKEVCGVPCRVVENLISCYLHSGAVMTESNQAWIQTRHLLRRLFLSFNRTDTIRGVMFLLSKTRTYFMTKCPFSDKHRHFFVYAVGQLNQLDAVLCQRLEYLERLNS